MTRAADSPLVDRLGEWLIDRALAEHPAIETFEQFCIRLKAIGLPVARCRVTWPTLHPLFSAETMLWRDGQEMEFRQFPHQDSDSEEWRESPARWMLDNGIVVMRRRLAGDEPQLDFPLLADLAGQGYTDFLALRTPLSGKVHTVSRERDAFGLYVTWVSDRASGFSDGDVEVLLRLQRFYAVAAKTALQPRMTENIANTYLGETVGRQVLAGQIKLGSGQRTRALVWYSDLRNSTQFSETLLEADYLDLLNDYFSCVAEAALDAGGEILAFIGDAVLAIFPVPEESECRAGSPGEARLDQVALAATDAARGALAAAEAVNGGRRAAGRPTFRFGIAMNIGEVMFGNIGIDRRLSFSVIGTTVNEVARIETMTKMLGTAVLATRAVAEAAPGAWDTRGAHPLRGFEQPVELFALAEANGEAKIAAE
ncbi:adenylate/guanylate cyclase domain-containing protein [Aureimonas leprariae]|uniref:Adenylate/guanylate cyclase domain-containing protein n=1 Tax=Plantimonas leprariae TaxID=2615207 RepID=A0A7V7TVL3_9HYPH|nr:adenylate/guanylate cyclase domain-containing protein [Aureimonas leprariae]KAB0677764.1 adenylate/guanylate cyclase domain-containing protein [Aureimonas leprariae]